MFEVRNMAFSYGRQKVLRDVSFVVSPGETVSIVGANGAGKTTLMRTLANLALPEAGTIRVDGQDALLKPLRYRSQIGYMQELPALYDDMTVKSYLRYRALLKGEPDKRIRRRIGEATEVCCLTEVLNKSMRRLSFGMKKRVALADAMLLRPRVLILDDVLAGLDRAMREAAGGIISSFAAFSSVIVTGHEIHDLVKWSTRILVLRDGVIAATIPAAGIDSASLVERIEKECGGAEK